MGQDGDELVLPPVGLGELRLVRLGPGSGLLGGPVEPVALPLQPLAVGDVLDGEEEQLILAPRREAAGVEEHRLRADVLEIVLDLEILERAVRRDDVLQERPQGRDVPLAVPEVVDESADGLGRGDPEGLVEGAIRRPDVEVPVEDQERPPHRGHDALGVRPGRRR